MSIFGGLHISSVQFNPIAKFSCVWLNYVVASKSMLIDKIMFNNSFLTVEFGNRFRFLNHYHGKGCHRKSSVVVNLSRRKNIDMSQFTITHTKIKCTHSLKRKGLEKTKPTIPIMKIFRYSMFSCFKICSHLKIQVGKKFCMHRAGVSFFKCISFIATRKSVICKIKLYITIFMKLSSKPCTCTLKRSQNMYSPDQLFYFNPDP